MIELHIKNLQRKVKVDIGILRMYLERCLRLFEGPPSEIGVVLVSNQKIKKLNNQFLNKNSITDVMSFRVSKKYGEVLISAEMAAENSRRYGLTTEDEILYLILHGYLHLKSYRDDTGTARKKMFAKQDAMFKKMLKTFRG
jgi:probable rRNA maturation factor